HIATPQALQEFERDKGFKFVIDKRTNIMHIFKGDVPVKAYRIVRSNYDEDKLQWGDMRTPEGIFPTDVPVKHGKWDIWLTINAAQRAKADYVKVHGEAATKAIAAFEKRYGAISHDSHLKRFNQNKPRDLPPMWNGVGIHGGGNRSNWTHGCLALGREDALDLYHRMQGARATTLILPAQRERE
ncbi:MAG: L,D-transpeptidase, partial [Candidatus Micrarchaeota archaeon]